MVSDLRYQISNDCKSTAKPDLKSTAKTDPKADHDEPAHYMISRQLIDEQYQPAGCEG